MIWPGAGPEALPRRAPSVSAEPGELASLPATSELRRVSTALNENRPPSGWRGTAWRGAPAAYVGARPRARRGGRGKLDGPTATMKPTWRRNDGCGIPTRYPAPAVRCPSGCAAGARGRGRWPGARGCEILGRMTPDEAVDRGFLDAIGALADQPLRSAALPVGQATSLTGTRCLEIFGSQLASLHLDVAARVLRAGRTSQPTDRGSEPEPTRRRPKPPPGAAALPVRLPAPARRPPDGARRLRRRIRVPHPRPARPRG